MGKFDDCHRAYKIRHEAWYANRRDDPQIWFGLYVTDDGTGGEMCMRWVMQQNRRVPLLEVFDDAWASFATFATEFVPKLAEVDDEKITPAQFAAILDSIGFVDETKRIEP